MKENKTALVSTISVGTLAALLKLLDVTIFGVWMFVQTADCGYGGDQACRTAENRADVHIGVAVLVISVFFAMVHLWILRNELSRKTKIQLVCFYILFTAVSIFTATIT